MSNPPNPTQPIVIPADSKKLMMVASSNWVEKDKDPLLRYSPDRDILARPYRQGSTPEGGNFRLFSLCLLKSPPPPKCRFSSQYVYIVTRVFPSLFLSLFRDTCTVLSKIELQSTPHLSKRRWGEGRHPQ